MPLKVHATAAGSPRPYPQLLQRIALLAIALSTIAAGPCSPQSPQQASSSPPPLAASGGLDYYLNAHPYLDEPFKRLIKHIPELGTLRPADDQALLPIILMHTGAKIGDFFDNIVDLVAHEEIGQEILTFHGDAVASQHLGYNYLILLNRHENPPRYEEYRTDLQGNRSDPEGIEDGYAVTAGFALKCIYFSRPLQPDSVYRYLGDQQLGSRDTYVVAFAQQPAQATFWGTVTGDWGTVRILDQGIAWIDKATFRIIRIRTDLLAAHSDIGLARQTTEVTFNEVQIPDVPRPLWLPSEAEVYAEFQGHVFRNIHHYTDYQRFRVSVKMGEPKSDTVEAGAPVSP